MADPVEVLVLAVDRQGGSVTARLTGELDAATAPSLVDGVTEHLDDGATSVVVDLGGLSFCDSSGLRALMVLHEAVGPLGGSLTLVEVPPRVASLLSLTGIDRLVTVKEADTSTGQPAP